MKLTWDETGKRLFETGVDQGVLYPLNKTNNTYDTGVAWNGLTSVQETPSGADSNPLYADNIKYLNLRAVEEFGGTIEAYTYPDEFAVLDGSAALGVGVTIGQQSRGVFGLSYRTRIGNDVSGDSFGYKLHLVYGATASPSERQYETVNDNPDAITFSWEFTTNPVNVEGFKPTALIVIDSTKCSAIALAALEEILYGTAYADPRLPLPNEVATIINGSVTYEYDAVTDTTGKSPKYEGWYESDGGTGYTLSTDVAPDETKTYYTRSIVTSTT